MEVTRAEKVFEKLNTTRLNILTNLVSKNETVPISFVWISIGLLPFSVTWIYPSHSILALVRKVKMRLAADALQEVWRRIVYKICVTSVVERQVADRADEWTHVIWGNALSLNPSCEWECECIARARTMHRESSACMQAASQPERLMQRRWG